MKTINEQPSQEEKKVKELLDAFFTRVLEMPMKEQVKMLADFQEFVTQQQQKAKAVKK